MAEPKLETDFSELERLIRNDKDRSKYEMEVTFPSCREESDLHQNILTCNKNPGHRSFIPVQEFTTEHLLPHWKHPFVFETIRLLSQETVRVIVRGSSEQRPENYPFSGKIYRTATRYGTGTGSILTHYSIVVPCSMENCALPKEHNEYGRIWVTTATHVVFDEFEAKNTTVEFFYDKVGERSSVVKARAIGMRSGKDQGVDCAVMECLTHDEALVKRLEDNRKRYEEICRRWDTGGFERMDRSATRLAAIVSHPHGTSKHISLGQMQDVFPNNWSGIVCYGTATCPGSSGAAVLNFLPESRMAVPFTPAIYYHSMIGVSGYNEAAATKPSYFL